MKVWTTVEMFEAIFETTPIMRDMLTVLPYRERRIAVKAFATGACALTLNLLSEEAVKAFVAVELTTAAEKWVTESTMKEIFDRFWPGDYE